MRNIFLSIVLLFWLLPFTAGAQGTHILGYCSDDLVGSDMIGVEGEARMSCAIRLPKSTMQRYKDGRIVRIKVAVRDGLQNGSVWIRSSLGESSIVVQSMGAVVNGWNEVELNNPYTVDGEEIYIGYTFSQPDGVKAILAKGTGDENTSFVAIDNVWDDYHSRGVGILFIQAVVEADLPTQDIAVIDGRADSLYYYTGGRLNATATIENLGVETLGGYTLSWQVDGGEAVSDGMVYGSLDPGEMRSAETELSLDGLEEGKHHIHVTVVPTDIDDERLENNTFDIPFFVYESSYPRQILLEHFTSLFCVNCPPVDKRVENMVESRTDVDWVSHHVGYHDDEFTIDASEPFVNFGVYGNPFIMLDRRTIVGDTPAFVVSGISDDILGQIFDYAASQLAFVQLSPTLTMEEGILHASVSGEAKAFFQSLYPRATINMFLVEDSVLAIGSQSGDSNKKYHDNILRAALTRQTGERITWTDDTHFLYSATKEADPSWQIDHLRLVAFVTETVDRSTGYPTGAVLNSAQVFLDATQGIHATAIDAASSPRYYTIGGVPVAAGNLRPGIYIVDDGHGVRKTIIR